MALSSVTDSDYLQLLANFEILSEKKWNCEACIRTTDSATRNAVKGCNGGKTFGLATGGRVVFTVTRCIGNYYNSSVFEFYRAFRLYQKGVMPFEGALMDQPAKVLDVFSVLEALDFERQSAAQKNAERKGNHGR